ncbi:glycosyltransferase family 2 protein [Bacillus sp. FSL R5-0654]|uniref:glycosyltransferase family 2 protein n=1 Tax=Bacillus TaxID=1386 RepID=UPI0003FBBF8E|nr:MULTISPECIES: glycosyltransferase family 2 protein [Bacillus]PNU23348.1 glycosyltransferase family 2 protein [Bacillus stratosphericus]APJ10080.1 glycosyltransferase [Bacillus safensis]KAB3537543.1 glycosyltransferase family 2 protein [Bacillus safensis]KAB3543539.1 glycosyltransferase family 2 protein [Bacillus safensis]MBR0607390.1 glycosyltransferase family 2 protein [Bacillus safensis]
MNEKPKVSVIIPSYNAKERLEGSLFSLTLQETDIPFEVIVADNGSTDGTMEMLENIEVNFPFKKVRIPVNQGIAKGRNHAIREAEGDLLIFHDSDMLAEPRFIQKHAEAHADREDLVICGVCWKRIYRYFYKAFDKDHMKRLKKQGLYKRKMEDKTPLLSLEEVENGAFLEKSFDLQSEFIDILKDILETYHYDLGSYELPWRFFITNNSSVKRKHVMALGMFDENIVRYGFEDYDLGIRLNQLGLSFELREDIMSVHQEHPSNLTSFDDIKYNILYMCEKYNNIDSIDVHLAFSGPFSHTVTNDIVKEVRQLRENPAFDDLLSYFLELLHLITERNVGIKRDKKDMLTAKHVPLKKLAEAAQLAREEYGCMVLVEAIQGLTKELLRVDLFQVDVL